MRLLQYKPWDETVDWLEWEMQAFQVMRMRKILKKQPDLFAFAGDMGGMATSKASAQQAKLCGLEPGETDLRIYLPRGKLVMPENKRKRGRLSTEQKDRHALLKRLGHDVRVIWADTPWDAWLQLEAILNEQKGFNLLSFMT